MSGETAGVGEVVDATRTAYDQLMRQGAGRPGSIVYLSQIRDIDTPKEFAATAWRVAISPAMSPGLVRMRSDLNGVTLNFDEDGEGILRATVRVPLTYHRLRGASERLRYSIGDWHAGEQPARFPEAALAAVFGSMHDSEAAA